MNKSEALPPLATWGNKIVSRNTGQAMMLRGINRSGLEYSSPSAPGPLARAALTESELDEIACWGCNIIRLPINQEWALRTANYDAEPYLAALDFVVEQAKIRRMYTLLDLQWLDTTPRGTNADGSVNRVPSLPNAGSILMWRQLAARYRESPCVLFDVFNEPHDKLDDDKTELLLVGRDGDLRPTRRRRVGYRQWAPWCRLLVSAIRDVSPMALIFVPGIAWAYDLSGFPVNGVTDVIYSTHVYPSKAKSWRRAFGKAAERLPVFLGEWGGGDEDLDWGARLAAYAEQLGIGWTAWSWCDRPHLIQPGTQWQPTKFGSLVNVALHNPAKPKNYRGLSS